MTTTEEIQKLEKRKEMAVFQRKITTQIWTVFEYDEEISIIEEISEYCIMGFRKINGIDKKEFKYRFGEDIEDIYKEEIKKHVNGGLLNNYNENIYLTKKGLDLMNQVEIDFFKI